MLRRHLVESVRCKHCCSLTQYKCAVHVYNKYTCYSAQTGQVRVPAICDSSLPAYISTTSRQTQTPVIIRSRLCLCRPSIRFPLMTHFRLEPRLNWNCAMVMVDCKHDDSAYTRPQSAQMQEILVHVATIECNLHYKRSWHKLRYGLLTNHPLM